MNREGLFAPEVRKLLRELLPFKGTIAIVAVTGVVMSGAMAGMVACLKDLFDALQARDAHLLSWRIPAAILLLALVANISRYFHYFLANFTSDRVVVSLQRQLQRKFMVLNLTFHTSFKSGSGGLLSRILNDIWIIRNGMLLVSDFFREPLTMLFMVGLMLYRSWRLTLFLFILIPIVFWFLRQIGRSLRKYGRTAQETLEKLTVTIKETLDGVRIIQSFNLENEMASRFEAVSRDFLQTRKKIYSRIECSGPVTEFIAIVIIVGLFIYLGMQIVNQQATMGDFASFLGALTALQRPVKKLQESYVRIQETIVAARRLFTILEDQSEVPQVKNAASFPKDWQTIRYENVTFAYGEENILKKVNVTVKRGQVIALVGESGSGKSSFVNLLERFYDPTEGQIYVDNIPIREVDLKELRANIALVTQDVFLFSDTVERNIHAGDFVKQRAAVTRAAELANAHEFVSHLPDGYQSNVGDRGGRLSGGEKQRISIARALFKDAPVLILDEATSALDSVSEQEVQKGLERLMEGRTVFIIAHRLATVLKADRILVLKKGVIVEEGTHEELIRRSGEYHRFYELQMAH